MHIVDVQVTLTGTAINLSAVSALAAIFEGQVSKIRFTPDDANAHTVSITGPNGVSIKRLAPPSSGTAITDEWDWDVKDGHNLEQLSELSVNGTSGEKVDIVAFVG